MVDYKIQLQSKTKIFHVIVLTVYYKKDPEQVGGELLNIGASMVSEESGYEPWQELSISLIVYIQKRTM